MDSPELGDERPKEYPPPPMPRTAGRGEAVAGLVLAAAAIIFPFLGIASIVSGYMASRKGNPLGRKVILAGVVGMVVGIVLAIAVNGGDEEALALLR